MRDIITALAIACGITFVALVIGLVLDYRKWRERQRLLAANWVLKVVARCQDGGVGKSSDSVSPRNPEGGASA
jgi:hypothetical protein